MLIHFIRGCFLCAIGLFLTGLFLTGGPTAMVVGAKGVALIVNTIAFVQSECMEKGVTI